MTERTLSLSSKAGLALLATVLAAGCATTFDHADEARRHGDLRTACSLYEKAARGGSIAAQVSAGNCWYYGLGGFTEDKVRGAHWWTKAASAGSQRADVHLMRNGIARERRLFN